MAINYKLVTATSDASSPDTVFTATAVATHVKSVRIANESGGALTYHLAVYDNSATIEVPITIPATSLPDDDVDVMVEPFNLQNGDYIKLYSSGAGVKVAITLAENTDTAGATTSDDLAEGTTNLYLTSAERTKLTGIATGAEVNQNAFSNVAVSGQTTVAADAKTDTLTLVAGTGVTLTTDAGADSITIAASGSSSNSFETIAVAGQSSVVADSGTDTLTLVAGTGITLTTDAGADSITITNSATGANAFGNVAVAGQTTVAADSTNDTLTIAAGTGITITTNDTTDTVTITNSVTAPNTFGTIAVAGQNSVVADSTTDTLTLTAGTGITITTNDTTDTVTITNAVTAPNTFGTIAVATQSSVVADSTTDTLTFAVAGGMAITTNATTDTITFDSKQLDDDDVTLQGARLIDMNGETLTLEDSTQLHPVALFTSDSVDLREVSIRAMDNGTAGYIQLFEAANNGTNGIRLQAPTNLATSPTFTLPGADGTSGQVMQTNGSGGLSFVTKKATQVTGKTVLTGAWSLVSGVYEASISDAAILSTSIVNVIPNNTDAATIRTAGLLPRTDSSAGAVKIYSTSAPAASITVTLNIFDL